MSRTPAHRVTDPAELAALFGGDELGREVHVYGLADLDEPLWSRSRWWRHGDAAVGVLDLAGDGSTMAFYAVSAVAPESTLALLDRVLGEVPPGAEGTGPVGLVELLSRRRPVDDLLPHVKLAVDAATLNVPVPSPGVTLVTLGPDDVEEITDLHDSAPGAVFFLPAMLTDGVHVGTRLEGRLVAVAGTHVRSRRHRVAAIGGVLTRPDHRGRGLGGVVVGELARRLLRAGDTVGLNVVEDNHAARRVYRRLGFRVVHRYEEARVR